VTGDHERYRVCGAGSRNGSSRTWVADAGGHFPVQLHFTGVRNAELTHLKVSDIDSQRMVIHIQGGNARTATSHRD
jgi:integrase